MDKIEFETRYRAYEWLNRKFELNRDKKQILSLVKIGNGGQLQKHITETNPDELKVYTTETFTPEKSDYISNIASKINIWDFTLADYFNRLEYELKVIKEMGFYAYILIVQDFINRAKTHKIPVWPWRWSAAGSLLMYLVWIVDIDPMVFGLYFERFLNPSRVSMPDVDIDFDDEWREKVFEYVSERYGHNNVSRIGTFGTMTAKAAFKDVARVLWVPFDRANALTNLMTIINDDRSVNLRRCFDEIEELKTQAENDPVIQKTIDISERLLNTIRQTWIHACGTLICPENISNLIPAQYSPNIKEYKPEERYVTQFTWPKAEDLWLLKMDFLWLANISIIKNTIKIIHAQYKTKNEKIPDLFKNYFVDSSFFPDIHDQNVYETVFQKWNTTGIFQFESEGMKRYMMLLKPDRLEDLIAMTSLYRPGPMEFIPSFINRKHWTEEIIYGNSELFSSLEKAYGAEELANQKNLMRQDMDPILNVTYGVAVYQEQLMSMSQAVAGFSLSKADDLRKAIGKKIVDKVKKIKADFVKWALQRWYKEQTATWVYEKMIEPAALYSFNKSHAAAYSMISYQTAYLKTYYPVEFWAAVLRSSENSTEDLAKFINEIKSNWIDILAPNINESFTHVAAINGKIRLGFLCIKWVWYDVSELIQNEREKNGKFVSFGDFLLRCQKAINKKSLEWLIKSGGLSDFHNIATLLNNIDYILERTKLSASGWASGGLFGSVNEITLKTSPEPDLITRLKTEYEVFKTFVSWHPLDGIYAWIKSKYVLISQFKNSENYGIFEIVWYIQKIQRAKKKWYFVKIEDISDTIEFFVKDPMDLQEFDIVYISGYKGKTAKWDKIIKLKHEDVVRFATNSNKYDPKETVAVVKAKRILPVAPVVELDISSIPKPHFVPSNNEEVIADDIDITPEETFDNNRSEEDMSDNISDLNLESETEDTKDEINIIAKASAKGFRDKVEDIAVSKKEIEKSAEVYKEAELSDNTAKDNKYIYDMPNDINVIKQIWKIISENPGNICIQIGTKKLNTSEDWVSLIQKLLS